MTMNRDPQELEDPVVLHKVLQGCAALSIVNDMPATAHILRAADVRITALEKQLASAEATIAEALKGTITGNLRSSPWVINTLAAYKKVGL